MPGKAHGQLAEHGERSGGRVLPHCAAISAHSCIGHYTLRSGARFAIFLFTQTNLTSSYLATLRCCCTDQTRTRFTLTHDAAAPTRHARGSPCLTMLLHRPDTQVVHPVSRCCCTDQTPEWFTCLTRLLRRPNYLAQLADLHPVSQCGFTDQYTLLS